MKYKSIITSIGILVPDFLNEKMMIIFNNNAPKELEEMSVLHTIVEFDQKIEVGDIFVIGEKKYKVTAVGDDANKTFKELGHCTLKFTGRHEVELPGQIELLGDEIPKIKIGDILGIL
ncbi:PTS glucitol/sorbitol transporter subunit IIA [Thermoanaerobacterium thermosaccharolyticum]|uniref:PTS glucitol/sorbitol transporter subunit IIA n=1 Tax=Thermoanaerobacterium thermosaccharolyticum TaxID=1517 RepID=UPI003DA9DB94